MSALPWILGAVGVGGVVLFVRSRQKTTSDGNGGACDALCAAAASQGIPESACKEGLMYRACKAAGGVLEWIEGPDWAAMDAQNKALNGDVELELGPLGGRTVNPITRNPALHGTVLRFKNGGVPFAGAPGWEKCAPGTQNMYEGGGVTLDIATGKWTPTVMSAAFSGATGDPTSVGPFTADRKLTLPPVVGGGSVAGQNKLISTAPKTITEAPFPLPLAGAAQGYYWQGQPFVCDQGIDPNATDHRDGSAGRPVCVGAFASTPQGRAFGLQGQGHAISSQTFDCSNVPPDMTWIDATASTPGHWERMRSGQTQNLGPCAPAPVEFHAGMLAATFRGKAAKV